MRTRVSAAAAFAGALLLVSALPTPAQAACDFFQTLADGRVKRISISSGTNDIAFFFRGVTGRSYSVEAINTNAPYNAGTVNANWGPALSGCPITDVAGLKLTNTIEPATQNIVTNHFRASFTAPSTSYYVFRVGNTSATAVTMDLDATDTTMFSPAFTTNGTYNTFWSFQNTTNATCTGVLSVYDATGGAIGAPTTIVVNAGAIGATNTQALGVTRNKSGSVQFSHDCPPGAFVVTAAIANFTSTPGYFQAVPFEAPREARTH